MNEIEFENQLHNIAVGMEFPRTPDIARYVMKRLPTSSFPSGRGARGEGKARLLPRKLVWSLTFMLVLLSSLLLIPPARAAIIEFFQIGVIRIFPRSVEPTSALVTTATPQDISSLTATPNTSSSLIPLLDKIGGETKLANIQQATPYPILLPTYPPNLGQPNHVYVQDAGGSMTVLVWTDPSHPEKAILSLHFIPSGSWVLIKSNPVVVQETQVNGQSAVWTKGPYPLLTRSGNMELTRLIDGHVLIWTDGDVTYRLETDKSLEEALKMAESLQPIP